METIELKFLLKLLAYPGYRAPMTQIKPNPKTLAAERDRICRRLRDRGLVHCRVEIQKFKIEPAGKALLKLDTRELPLTQLELQALQASAKKVTAAISPADAKLPAAERQTVVQSLVQRGLVKIAQEALKEVWLSDVGQQHLRDLCDPTGNSTITLSMLGHYLRFMRRALPAKNHPVPDDRAARNEKDIPENNVAIAQPLGTTQKPDETHVLQLIQDLDRTLGTENYLPIFHLRQRLQPPFSKDELDQILYRLQQQDRLELSSLQEATVYSPEEIAAGIPQEIGGPLFFIALTPEAANA